MKIINHLLEKTPEDSVNIRFLPSPNFSESFTQNPHLIVTHYTAGASLDSSANWLRNPMAKASAHIIIGKNGDIIQLVPFNKKAWHAGKSKWKNKTNINRYSIGIELDNAGKLSKHPDGYYTSFNKKLQDSEIVLAKHKSGSHEEAWEIFTQKQIQSFTQVCQVIIQTYPIEEIIGHDDIAPKRKTDPGPAFPLQKLEENILRGRHDTEDTKPESEVNNRAIVTASYLNIRSRANINSPAVNKPLRKGTFIKVIEIQNDWSLVSTTIKGWVNNKWIKDKI